MARQSVDNWLARFAATPVLAPYPGWVLGSGQSHELAAWLRKKIWRLGRHPFDVPWLEGLNLTLYPGNETCRSIFVTGRFEPNEFCLLAAVLKPGMTFIDAGANIGLYTLFAARRVDEAGCVLALEPSSREREILAANLERNLLNNVKLRQIALSDQAAEVELLVAAAEHSGHNTLGGFGYNTVLDHRENVRTSPLDEIVRQEKLARVDVIKMDIEGAELSALRGASGTLERHRPVILLELSDRALQHQNASSREVLALLAQHGYRTYGFSPAKGLPMPLEPRAYFDSENVVAVYGESQPW